MGREFYLPNCWSRWKSVLISLYWIASVARPAHANALCAAKEILVPLQCEFLPWEGIVKLLQTYEQVKKRLNPQLGLLGVVLTMFDGRNRLTASAGRSEPLLPEQIFKTVIPAPCGFPRPRAGKSILHYDIKSKGSEAYLEPCQGNRHAQARLAYREGGVVFHVKHRQGVLS